MILDADELGILVVLHVLTLRIEKFLTEKRLFEIAWKRLYEEFRIWCCKEGLRLISCEA